MVRISAIFIAFCVTLIAASLGVVLFLRFGFSAVDSALIALGVLSVLALFNAIIGRKRTRAAVRDQVSTNARGSGDLARQLGEFGRRLNAIEGRVEGLIARTAASFMPSGNAMPISNPGGKSRATADRIRTGVVWSSRPWISIGVSRLASSDQAANENLAYTTTDATAMAAKSNAQTQVTRAV